MKYSGRWAAHVNDEKRAEFENLIDNSTVLLDRLKEICYNMYIESENKTYDFDDPNWAYKTAGAVGYQKALKNVMKLLTPVEDKNTNG